jgi:hypothetical protein
MEDRRSDASLAAISHMSELRRKTLETCVMALLDVQQAYQEMFDVMPVAWQTYDDIVTNAINEAGVLDPDPKNRKRKL